MAEIRNPNLQTQGPGASGGGGGDMRTTIGFAALLLVVLLGYQYFFKPKPAANPQTHADSVAAPGSAWRGKPATQLRQPLPVRRIPASRPRSLPRWKR